MDDLLEAERFNAELDELLDRPGSPVAGRFRPELALAQRLVDSDLSRESRVKETLARALEERADKVFHPGLLDRFIPRPRTLALCGGLAGALLAPLAFHLIQGSDEQVAHLQAGFNSQQGPLFSDGSPYEVSGMARGGVPGEGMDVITPLTFRDPSRLIVSGDIKGVAGGSSTDGTPDRSVAVPPGPPQVAENAYQSPVDQPLSTFSIDIDKTAFAEARRLLLSGRLPPPESVRIEAFVNAFRYGYPEPPRGQNLSINLESAACPWNEGHSLARIGLRASAASAVRDVKLQVEFNPARVKAYRLIGYEPGKLKARDFNDDAKGGGDLSEGQTVTALYEIVPHGRDVPGLSVDTLKYQKTSRLSPAAGGQEMLTVKVRAKAPSDGRSRLQTAVLMDSAPAWRKASADFRAAAAAAGLGMLLRRSEYRGALTYSMVRDISIPDAEFLRLNEKARRLDYSALP